MENKKIAQATHNIYAYRIQLPNGVVLQVILTFIIITTDFKNNKIFQDCADDGENHAGSRLLHLLQIVDVMNCVVVVSRW